VLLLVPICAPDESYWLVGTLATAPFYALFVGGPGVLLGLVTARRSLLIAGTVVLTATAAWAAIEMVASDDAQAGLAVFLVAYVGGPLLVCTLLVEWIARWQESARSSR